MRYIYNNYVSLLPSIKLNNYDLDKLKTDLVISKLDDIKDKVYDFDLNKFERKIAVDISNILHLKLKTNQITVSEYEMIRDELCKYSLSALRDKYSLIMEMLTVIRSDSMQFLYIIDDYGNSNNYLKILPKTSNSKVEKEELNKKRILNMLEKEYNTLSYEELNTEQKQGFNILRELFYNEIISDELSINEYGKIKQILSKINESVLIELIPIITAVIKDSEKNKVENIKKISDLSSKITSFANKIANGIDYNLDLEENKNIISSERFKEMIHKRYENEFSYIKDNELLMKTDDVNINIILKIISSKVKVKYTETIREKEKVIKSYIMQKMVDKNNNRAIDRKELGYIKRKYR